MEQAKDDPTRFRVNLICACQNDLAFGYGPTLEEARANAERTFRRQHGRRARWVDVITEQAVEHTGGGSHYEQVQT